MSWNGGGFDLPVLHYRALKHGIQAPRYWEKGESDRDFKWNNYLARFHWRHVDLMDVLANFNNRAFAKLDEIAVMLGFPGKLGMSGAKVWDTYLEGGIKEIRDYCETDVLNTWLVYLRFEYMRGNLDDKDLQRGLVPREKQFRVANYAKNMTYEVGIIAHSCGVKEPRQLRRFHCRMVQDDGRSQPLDELYPEIRH